MMTVYYKAVRPDGTDFRTGTIDYMTGETVHHPRPVEGSWHAADYLSVSTVCTDFPGAHWPWRILEVEAVGRVWRPDAGGSKVAVSAVRVVRELPAYVGFGPQGEQVVALLAGIRALTLPQVRSLAAAWDADRYAARAAARDAAQDAAWNAARGAAWYAARGAAWYAAWDVAALVAARDAALALVCRDLIGDTFTQAHYDLLTGPWRRTVGPIHPLDPDIREVSA